MRSIFCSGSNQHLSVHERLKMSAISILKLSSDYGSSDNLTCITVALPGSRKLVEAAALSPESEQQQTV